MFDNQNTHTLKTNRINNLVFHTFMYIFLSLFITVFPTEAKDNFLQLFEKEFKKVINTARPAVVKVLATHNSRNRLQSNVGNITLLQQDISSGILLDKNGYIATTTFSFSPNKIEVVFHNDQKATAKVIGIDQLTDIVVLKVDDELPKRVKQGDSTQLDIGSFVFTIGSTHGDHPIVSFGIVSGCEYLPELPCDELIKINAPISPGNSGGAVINTSGEVVGMIMAILTEQTDIGLLQPTIQLVTEQTDIGLLQPTIQLVKTQEITFALPIETVKSVADEIIKKGKVSRGWLGVEIETSDFGVFITQVVQDSPAQKSGLLPRDIILEFNNDPIRHYFELLRRVGTSTPSTDITLKIRRDGHIQSHTVKLGERQDSK